MYIHNEREHNTVSADFIVPQIIKIINPKSVLDIGCGIGTWLSVFKDNGIDDIFGVDGEYVDKSLLFKYINEKQFKACNLNKKIDLGRKFDLAVSLEVAEHIESKNAYFFIENLVRHSESILFSAAIPSQGGQNHVNEQWLNYWIDIFQSFGYKSYDIFRPVIWGNNNVYWWYKQNMLFFSSRNFETTTLDTFNSQNIVHPELYQLKLEEIAAIKNFLYTSDHKVSFKEFKFFFRLFLKKTFYLLKRTKT